MELHVPVTVLKDELPFASCQIILRVYEHGQKTQEISFCTDENGKAELKVEADEFCDAGLTVNGHELFGRRPLKDGISIRL
ncbi:hypothetical protein BH11ARM2_BH11ARM2_19390 [soil metagenome]